jgi:chromosome segregation ATPase
MSSCGSKAKAVMVVLVGVFGLLCVGFGVSVTEKYRLQKERVHALEKQLRAGRTEVLKIPDLMDNLDKVEVAKKEVEGKFTACASEKDALVAKAAELQKEVDTFGAIKVAVGVQISGLQTTIQEQQNKLNAIEESKGKLAQQLASLEEEKKGLAEKSDLQTSDMKRRNDEIKNQLVYFTEAKKLADQELAEKQKALSDLQKAKEDLEKELAKIKMQEPTSAPQSSLSTPHFPVMNASAGNVTDELDKTFALLRERITAPEIALDEVSVLLSRMDKALKSLR